MATKKEYLNFILDQLSGLVGVIIKKLMKQGIKTYTGKDSWSKRTIDTILAMINMQEMSFYLKGRHSECYLSKKNHPVIISEEAFKSVQFEKGRRSNVIMSKDGVKRKSTKYSSKKKY